MLKLKITISCYLSSCFLTDFRLLNPGGAFIIESIWEFIESDSNRVKDGETACIGQNGDKGQ